MRTDHKPPALHESHEMKCVEIWGGNRATNTSVATTGLHVWVYAEPHQNKVGVGGGDLHYLSLCQAGKIARLAIADVAGHGAEVDELALLLRREMRRHMNRFDQAGIARSLNDAFGRLADSGRFATAILATYDTDTDHLVICNAGHPRPLLRRFGERTWTLLDHTASCAVTDAGGGASGLPLGVIDETDYFQFAVPLTPGDEVLFFTDALIEAAGDDGRQLGESGLAELLAGVARDDPGMLVQETLERVRRARHDAEALDDVTVLALRHHGGAPPALNLFEKARALGRMLGSR